MLHQTWHCVSRCHHFGVYNVIIIDRKLWAKLQKHNQGCIKPGFSFTRVLKLYTLVTETTELETDLLVYVYTCVLHIYSRLFRLFAKAVD